jgi:hypothetical protein
MGSIADGIFRAVAFGNGWRIPRRHRASKRLERFERLEQLEPVGSYLHGKLDQRAAVEARDLCPLTYSRSP